MKLKDLLKEKNMSGYRFSQLSGVHLPAVYSLINGKRDPLKMTVITFKKVADALGYTMEDLYNLLNNE